MINFGTSSPKLRTDSAALRAGRFEFYAGYSEGFIRDVVGGLGLSKEALILDPWNGSGTTTYTASRMGFNSIGVDVNPAMVIVAAGRALTADDVAQLPTLLEAVRAGLGAGRHANALDDPLTSWFHPKMTADVRRVERCVWQAIAHRVPGRVRHALERTQVPRVISLFYTALFEALKRYALPYRTSNPTWVAARPRGSGEVNVSRTELRLRLQVRILELAARGEMESANTVPRILLGSSECIPLPDASVDAVLGSPPYCTRIDYTVATRIELAVLGVDERSGFRNLREASMGTTVILRQGPPPTNRCLGQHANAFLESVASHPSKASSTYYYKQFGQYFSALADSVSEVARVVRPNGWFGVVVQDSYYKELHADLARIVAEMSSERGLNLKTQTDFPTQSCMRQIHPGSRSYRRPTKSVESVLLFRKD